MLMHHTLLASASPLTNYGRSSLLSCPLGAETAPTLGMALLNSAVFKLLLLMLLRLVGAVLLAQHARLLLVRLRRYDGMTVPPETSTFCAALCLSGNTSLPTAAPSRTGCFDEPRTQHMSC
jgi:hypothetical protein